MIEKDLLKEVKNMAIGVLMLSLIMIGIFAVCGFFSLRVVWGALLGSAVCILNYFFLAYCVSKAVDKGESGAKNYISGTYAIRMLVIAAAIIISIKMPQYFNYIATAIPFLFPRIVIMVSNLFNKKGDKNNERSEDTV